NLSSPLIAAGATPTILGGNIGYAGVFPSGSVSITVNNTSMSAGISPSNGTFSASFSTDTLPAGTYTINYSYAGDPNFAAATATGSLRVGSWMATGPMSTARSFFAAALLPNGKVLVAGGLDNSGKPLASAEVYDPA